MEPQFEELAKRITDDVARRISDDVANHVGATERRLSDQAKAHMESLREEVKLAAEGYGATLESINRQLQELNPKYDDRLADHDVVLANHNERITKLEKLT